MTAVTALFNQPCEYLLFLDSTCIVLFPRTWFGSAGILGTAGLLGSVDIDALVASLLPLVRQGMPTREAARVLTLGILGNTVVKFAISLIWGGTSFRASAAPGYLCILAALLTSVFLIPHR